MLFLVVYKYNIYVSMKGSSISIKKSSTLKKRSGSPQFEPSEVFPPRSGTFLSPHSIFLFSVTRKFVTLQQGSNEYEFSNLGICFTIENIGIRVGVNV